MVKRPLYIALVWNAGETLLKNKPHLVTFDHYIIVSLQTFQSTLKHLHCAFNHLFYDCFHTTAKCIFWILIRNRHFELKFDIQYFGPCVCQITSRCVIWNAHFKWRSRGVFQFYAYMCRSTGNAISMHVWLAGYLDILLPLECKIPNSASCVYTA